MNHGLSLRESLQTDVVLKAKKGQPRRYKAEFIRPGGSMGEREVTTRMRRKELAVISFRKWFGRAPDRAVGEYLDTAWAEDKRGNLVVIDQVNNFSKFPEERGLLLPEKCEAA